MLIMWLLLPLGLSLLAVGADRLVDGASALARRLNISPLIIGLTVVGVATSVPEMLVAAAAAMRDQSCMAIGNAVGSNIANIGLVLGISALVAPIHVASLAIRKEFGLMSCAVLASLFFLADLHISRFDALFMAGLLCLLLLCMWQIISCSPAADPLRAEWTREQGQQIESLSLSSAVLHITIGLLLLLVGAELLVHGAVGVATHYGLSELVVGLTIVAVGTSLPEMASGIASARKQEGDIAVGTVIGSNLFNALVVTAIPGILRPGSCPTALLTRDFPVMIGLTVIMGGMIFSRQQGRFSRCEGAILLTCFLIYQFSLYRAGAQ